MISFLIIWFMTWLLERTIFLRSQTQQTSSQIELYGLNILLLVEDALLTIFVVYTLLSNILMVTSCVHRWRKHDRDEDNDCKDSSGRRRIILFAWSLGNPDSKELIGLLFFWVTLLTGVRVLSLQKTGDRVASTETGALMNCPLKKKNTYCLPLLHASAEPCFVFRTIRCAICHHFLSLTSLARLIMLHHPMSASQLIKYLRYSQKKNLRYNQGLIANALISLCRPANTNWLWPFCQDILSN
jgi:hypothetical protein